MFFLLIQKENMSDNYVFKCVLVFLVFVNNI